MPIYKLKQSLQSEKLLRVTYILIRRFYRLGEESIELIVSFLWAISALNRRGLTECERRLWIFPFILPFLLTCTLLIGGLWNGKESIIHGPVVFLVRTGVFFLFRALLFIRAELMILLSAVKSTWFSCSFNWLKLLRSYIYLLLTVFPWSQKNFFLLLLWVLTEDFSHCSFQIHCSSQNLWKIFIRNSLFNLRNESFRSLPVFLIVIHFTFWKPVSPLWGVLPYCSSSGIALCFRLSFWTG